MTTPTQRIARLLEEGARFKLELPGQTSIDLTPDLIAALEAVQMGSKPRNLLNVNGIRRDLPTRVHFP